MMNGENQPSQRDWFPAQQLGGAKWSPKDLESAPPYAFNMAMPEIPYGIPETVPVEGIPRPISTVYSPFYVQLGQNEDESYFVTVGDGRVIERRVIEAAAENQILWHKPDGIEDAGGNPVQHDIAVDEAVYVLFPVDNKGTITATPYIEVAAKDVASSSYYPRVGDYAGAGGTFKYKLATLVDEGGDLKLVFDQAGSHINHIVERMEMVNLPLAVPDPSEGDFFQVLKTYLPDFDQAQFRALCSLPVTGGAAVIKDQNGNTVNIRRLAPRETLPQIQVTEDENAIRVEGNGVSGDNDAVTVEDGLVTTVKAFEMCDGDTFAVAYWSCLIEIQFEPPDNYYIYVERPGTTTTPDYVVYYFEGCAYLNTPPEGYPVFSTDPYPVINVPLYNLLDLGPFPNPPYV